MESLQLCIEQTQFLMVVVGGYRCDAIVIVARIIEIVLLNRRRADVGFANG